MYVEHTHECLVHSKDDMLALQITKSHQNCFFSLGHYGLFHSLYHLFKPTCINQYFLYMSISSKNQNSLNPFSSHDITS